MPVLSSAVACFVHLQVTLSRASESQLCPEDVALLAVTSFYRAGVTCHVACHFGRLPPCALDFEFVSVQAFSLS